MNGFENPIELKPVFLLSKNFPPIICGVGDYTFHLYTRLKAAGYDVRVITGKTAEVETFIAENQLVRDIYPIVDRWDRSCVRKIFDVLVESKASVLCIQYVPNGLSQRALPVYLLLLLIRAQLRSIAVGFFFHEVSVRVLFNGMKSFMLGSVQRMLSYTLHVGSKFSMTSSKIYSSYFRPFQIPVAPIPANIFANCEFVTFVNRNKKGPIRVFCFANRCQPIVIRAIAKCIKEYHVSLRFIIAGKMTSERAKWIKAEVNSHGIADSVEIFSESSGRSIARVLRNSDLFLHIESVTACGEGGVSSKSGIASAAMAAGLAIISTKGDMTDRSLYQHRKNILFIAKTSESCVADSICELASDSKLRLFLGLNAVTTYRQFFSWDRTVESYISIFSKIHGTNPS